MDTFLLRFCVDEMVDRVDLPEDKIQDAMKASSTSRHLSVDAPF